MKEFKTERFDVQGIMENMDGIDYIKYSVYVNGTSYDKHIANFGTTESLAYDNANVLFSDVPAEMFREVFIGYQEFLQMPVFFSDEDKSLSDECRNELLGMGAQFCKDTEHETRWFDTDCYVYKLGDHTSHE